MFDFSSLEVDNPKQSKTGGLATLFELKNNARVKIRENIDMSDKLIKRQIGTVKLREIKNRKSQL